MVKRSLKFSRVLLRVFLRREDYLEKSGDMEEVYYCLVDEIGLFRAKVWFWFQVVKAVPVFVVNTIYWRYIMIRNYIKIAFRNMIKFRGHSFLNIMGLSLGMACCLILFMYVHEEFMYDVYHLDGERVFRVYEEIKTATTTRIYAPIAWPVGPALLDKFPQVESAVRVYTFISDPLVKHGDIRFYEDRFIYAEADFFNILTFHFIRGDSQKALERPQTVVITKSVGLKYFGDTEPLGKTIMIDDREFEITGVIEDCPRNTHLKADFIGSLKSIENERWMSNWHGTECYTYIKLRANVDPVSFGEQMMRIGFDYVGKDWEAWGSPRFFHLQPVEDIHFHSQLLGETESPGNISMVLLMAGIGVLVLLIACINFVNLATARSFGRAKEVGLRKVVGGLRRELMLQFWGESILFALLAMMVSIPLMFIVLPYFNELAGTSFRMRNLIQPNTFLTFAFIVAFCGIGAGVYPSVLLSSYQPVMVLKNDYRGRYGGVRVREIMVVFQFAISILLIVGTLIISRQIEFMKHHHLGFDKEQKLVIPVRGGASIRENYAFVKQALLDHPAIKGATVSSHVPGRGTTNFAIELVGEADRRNQGMLHIYIDTDFIPVYDIEMVAGRSYLSTMQTDISDWDKVGGFLMNEAAVKAFGLPGSEEAIGKRLRTGLGGREGPVIGVTRNFHYRGLQNKVDPLILEYFPVRFQYITLALNKDALDRAMAHVERTWKNFFPDVMLESYFIDEDFNRQYRSEERLGRVAGTFTLMGLIIACLGLLGLTSFMAEQRTKEIGIRKVVGATVPSIVLMLNREYIKWVLVANVISWPVAWFVMSQWLDNFATRMTITLWPFVLSGLGALAVALLTVSYQSVKAALANPVNSLRYE